MTDTMKSPIYNLSLCSLENFHTSFLKWVGNEYGREFVNAFTDKTYNENSTIEYEDQKKYGKDAILDLRISIDNLGKKEYIVVENKVKSFPTEDQLKKYLNYFNENEAKFILLSLAPTLDLPEKWEYMSYSNLAEKMQNIFNDNFQYKKDYHDYHKYLIKDYINVIKYLSENFPQENSMVYDLYEQNDLGSLEDIYKKYRVSQLKNYICTNAKLPSDTVIDTDFRNKQGIVNVWYSFKELNLSFLIQIQYNEYRYCMVYGNENDNSLREDIATKLSEKNIWFNNCKNYYPRAKNYQSKKFCGYNPNFIYRYQTLKKLFNKNCIAEVTYQEIADKIQKDISDLDNNKNEIQKILL